MYSTSRCLTTFLIGQEVVDSDSNSSYPTKPLQSICTKNTSHKINAWVPSFKSESPTASTTDRSLAVEHFYAWSYHCHLAQYNADLKGYLSRSDILYGSKLKLDILPRLCHLGDDRYHSDYFSWWVGSIFYTFRALRQQVCENTKTFLFSIPDLGRDLTLTRSMRVTSSKSKAGSHEAEPIHILYVNFTTFRFCYYIFSLFRNPGRAEGQCI